MYNLLVTLVSSNWFFASGAIEGTACKKVDFFGLRSWWYYLPQSDFDGCNIKNFNFFAGGGQPSDVPFVLLAIVDDLLRIAGLVALGFIIYGAFQYTASQGSPDATAKAQSTVINALLGLAIAIVGAAFVAFLGNQLGGS